MALSPMMKQYISTKEEYKDCILMYRLGDFYEMFFDDAITASKELGLTLTGRDCGLEERAPMCGVPYHAVNSYISQLVGAGYNVAICDQVTEPKKGEIVQRSVTRVITPGTKIDDEMLDEKVNNFIVSITQKNGYFGIAWADITTGEINATHIDSKNNINLLVESLLRINPAEIICDEECVALEIKEVQRKILPSFKKYYQWAFEYGNASKRIKKQLDISSLESLDIKEYKTCVCAIGALFEYIIDTQKRELINFTDIKLIRDSNHLIIDNNTRRNLELLYSNRENKRYGTLFNLLNKTKTPMGARLLNKWLEEPLTDENRINNRLYAVKELIESKFIKEELCEQLGSIRDLSRLAGKISYGNVTPIDLLAIKNSIKCLPTIKSIISPLKEFLFTYINQNLSSFEDLYAYLDNSISNNATSQLKDGGFIKEGFSQQLDTYKNMAFMSKTLLSQLEEREREKTGIRTLKIGYNRVFGYYIEVSRSFQNSVPLNYVRKQTISNGERYITDELKELEDEILNSTDNAMKLENILFSEIVQFVKKYLVELIKTAELISVLDVITSFAIVSLKNNYVLPSISKDNNEIDIQEGRHPVVEIINREEQFVANDTYIDGCNHRTMILTGPNMAGKSTYMRQVALIAIMAQVGCFVPCKSAILPIFDRIFTRVGASDNLIMDQSTFMVEMIEVSNILRSATSNSLVILDEVGRGTSTLDGLSIAFAVTKYITKNIKCKTLFATHYHELTELEGTLEGVANYRITVKEINGKIIFLRKIVRGGANRSFGIEVASLAGLPKEVIKEAKNTLKLLEDSEIIASKRQLSIEDLGHTDIKNHQIIDRLRDIDLDEISPREALRLLDELKEMI